MIVIENADLIQGDATTASEVDFQIYGLDNNALANLADGQLANSIGTLYTANSTDVVTSIILVNTGAAHNHVNLYHKPTGGTSRRLIAKDLQLESGYSLHWEGGKCTTLNADGAVVTTVSVTQFLDDTAGGTDALVTKAPTSNAFYDAIRFSKRNIIINGGFTINQRVYVSAAALAATVYGHDRWKGGAGGGTYSFTQLASPTTITIAANKTLIQVVEDKMVYGGTYVLSWTGTCQARYAINSATPAGAYAASPISITGQTAGTTMSVEFGNGASSGTLGEVQLELGSVATPFEFRPYGQELMLCQRYYLRIADVNLTGAALGGVATANNILLTNGGVFPVAMRVPPTVTIYNGVNVSRVRRTGTGADITITTFNVLFGVTNYMGVFAFFDSGGTPFVVGEAYDYYLIAAAEL
jgi:hypothetical protein